LAGTGIATYIVQAAASITSHRAPPNHKHEHPALVPLVSVRTTLR